MAVAPDPKRKPRAKRPLGRPFDLKGEQMVVEGGMLSSKLSVGRGGVFFTSIDDIVRRKGWSTYRDMRHDDQVKATLSFKKILVHGRAWDVKPAQETKEAKDIAAFVSFNLQRINFKGKVKDALSAFEYGFSVGEKLWESGVYEGSRAILLKDIKHRDPTSIEIAADEHGNIQKYKQTAIGRNIEVSASDVWHYAHNSEFGNTYGMSDMRAAYKHWWAKKFIINYWNVYMERMGTPMTMMKYPQGSSEDLKTDLKSILAGLSSKTEILVPVGVEVDLIEATRGGAPGYLDALTFHNNSIARAMLMVSILGMGGEDVTRGADSQSQLHLRLLFKMADEVTGNVTHSFTKQVLEPLVDMNFEHDNLYPQIIWQDYGQFEGVIVADTIRLLHAAGILDLDQDDVNYARSVLGLPLRDEDDKKDEVIRPNPLPPPADPNKVPPKASQGNEIAKAEEDRKADMNTLRTYFDDVRGDVADLKAQPKETREPMVINVEPVIHLGDSKVTVEPAQVHVAPAPVNINVEAPAPVVIPAPIVQIGGPTVNIPKNTPLAKTFEYDQDGNIVKVTETETGK